MKIAEEPQEIVPNKHKEAGETSGFQKQVDENNEAQKNKLIITTIQETKIISSESNFDSEFVEASHEEEKVEET